MVDQTLPSWEPDLRLPARGSLQEFVSHDRKATLRIILERDEHARVEVNDRIVAGTIGFQNAAALAELYTRSHEILLVEQAGAGAKGTGEPRYYHIRSADGVYEVCSGSDLVAFVYEAERFSPMKRSERLAEAVDFALADSKDSLALAFSDQQEILKGLGTRGAAAIFVAAWVSRWSISFFNILQEDEFTPLSLTVSKAPDGAFYTIYRLANRAFLAELRSHHEAEKIGTFADLETARAYCDLFNAGRHSTSWISFTSTAEKEKQSQEGTYLLSEDADGFRLRLTAQPEISLGYFPSVRLAESYATAHRDALKHFNIHQT